MNFRRFKMKTTEKLKIKQKRKVPASLLLSLFLAGSMLFLNACSIDDNLTASKVGDSLSSGDLKEVVGLSVSNHNQTYFNMAYVLSLNPSVCENEFEDAKNAIPADGDIRIFNDKAQKSVLTLSACFAEEFTGNNEALNEVIPDFDISQDASDIDSSELSYLANRLVEVSWGKDLSWLPSQQEAAANLVETLNTCKDQDENDNQGATERIVQCGVITALSSIGAHLYK
jgi:hypothetical protein